MDAENRKIFEQVKVASTTLATLDDDTKNRVLLAVADAIAENASALLDANANDLQRMDKANALYDRLLLTPQRLEGIAADMRHVASLPSPLGHTLCQRTLPNGLRLRKVSVPFGVIGIIYEARPNVSFDVFSLCFKSGNACVLKGGKDADSSNRAIIDVIHKVLRHEGISTDVVRLLPATHEATADMLNAVGYIDLCIPRGGKKLINFVRDTARVPVIETGAGVVHAYFDKEADTDMGRRIITNAKTRRVSVCNALDTLIIHSSRLADLPALVADMADKHVEILADSRAAAALKGYPYIKEVKEEKEEGVFSTEFMDYKMGIKTVDSLDEALAHIARFGSGHSECIITADAAAAHRFQQMADAACIYWNAPTSFTDGAQFGLGAEIGISTQKLGPRGPMGLEEITTYKWLIEGEGQIRS